ncbi:N-acetyltransferase [Vibrio sp. T187]|uniref:GNAT family N-acetyltransferase n=1 Tax=Vibrio TaxID=662 RepID=UPI0010C9D597|nr:MULTISPECIES: GNAT family N-acetyltransferase [Vibrio]MBW3697260.1 N-acetyltransferase [Vibrio sp. T187]
MNNVMIEQLDPIKLPLIKRFYKEHYPSGKANKSELIIALYIDTQVNGVVRFRTIDKYRLLTGMAISTEKRGLGLGHSLMEHCQAEVLNNSDYCFAYAHLESFYKRHDFQVINAKELPNSLRILYERYTNSGKDLIPMHFQLNC